MTTRSGRLIKFGVCVWSTGNTGLEAVTRLGLPSRSCLTAVQHHCTTVLCRQGRVLTDSRLRVPSQPDVFALGDCAVIEERPLAQLAQVRTTLSSTVHLVGNWYRAGGQPAGEVSRQGPQHRPPEAVPVRLPGQVITRKFRDLLITLRTVKHGTARYRGRRSRPAGPGGQAPQGDRAGSIHSLAFRILGLPGLCIIKLSNPIQLLLFTLTRCPSPTRS